jgi:hypothetical protein
MFMILPHFFAFMCGMTSRQQFTTLINNESNVSCQSLPVVSLKSANGGPPVLLTRMSILLNLVAVALTMAWMSSFTFRFAGKAKTSVP